MPAARYAVFCGSNCGARPEYVEAACALGGELARRGIGLVYGGSQVGLMGVLADSVLAAGGEAVGVMAAPILAFEAPHPRLSSLHIVASLHERKTMMAGLAEGFIALPGGFGTLDELSEILTWMQLGVHEKPCAIVNTCGFFDPLLGFLDRVVSDRFLKAAHRNAMLVVDTPAAALEQMRGYRAPRIAKSIDGAGSQPTIAGASRELVPHNSHRASELSVVLFGAGHVARALVSVLSHIPCRITWVNQRREQFPSGVPEHVTVRVTEEPAEEVGRASAGSYFVVMARSRALVRKLSENILRRGDFAYFALIASKTERTRLERQLESHGVALAAIARMHCPVGLSGVGPERTGETAVAVAAAILQTREMLRAQPRTPAWPVARK